MSARRPQLLATAAATAAMAAATLTVTAPAPASAAPATTTYECSIPDLGDVDVPVTVDVTNLPTRLPVAVAVPAATWDVRANLRFDELTTAYLASRTDDVIAEIGDLGPLLGDKAVPVALASGVAAVPLAAGLDVPMVGTNGEFTPRYWADDLPLELPEAFTLDLYDGDHALLFSVDCEWWEGDLGVVGEISVVKQTSSMTRKLLKKPVKSTKRAKLLVTVTSETTEAAQGEVMATLGERNLVVGALTDGRITLKLPRLAVGKHRVTLTYLGSKLVDKTTRMVTVKVVAPK
jgi:hypothetical protein